MSSKILLLLLQTQKVFHKDHFSFLPLLSFYFCLLSFNHTVSIKFCSVLLNRIIPMNNTISVKTTLYNKRPGLNSPAPIRPIFKCLNEWRNRININEDPVFFRN